MKKARFAAGKDGVLIPFVTRRGDTGHRITATVFGALKEHYQPSYLSYQEAGFYIFFITPNMPPSRVLDTVLAGSLG